MDINMRKFCYAMGIVFLTRGMFAGYIPQAILCIIFGFISLYIGCKEKNEKS